jgi:hypothetical protein
MNHITQIKLLRLAKFYLLTQILTILQCKRNIIHIKVKILLSF